jgi:hypothetical protein
LQGEQKVAKFNETNAFNTVEMILAVVRLVKVETDLVISLNAPAQLANGSSEQTSVSETEKITIDMVKNEMKTLLNGLQVKDWRLFG